MKLDVGIDMECFKTNTILVQLSFDVDVSIYVNVSVGIYTHSHTGVLEWKKK